MTIEELKKELIGKIAFLDIFTDYTHTQTMRNYYEIVDIRGNYLHMDMLPDSCATDDAIDIDAVIRENKKELWGMRRTVTPRRKRRSTKND